MLGWFLKWKLSPYFEKITDCSMFSQVFCLFVPELCSWLGGFLSLPRRPVFSPPPLPHPPQGGERRGRDRRAFREDHGELGRRGAAREFRARGAGACGACPVVWSLELGP